jgi:NAD(P)-dependent dehydrogenase (short-subunit alcohol dehydrogenase family)
MTWDSRQLAEQTGRTVLITGANSGIGLEAARDLVGRGAQVVLAVRDVAKGEQAVAGLGGRGSARVVELDLADLDSVAQCAKRVRDEHGSLAALVCNAGVMGGSLQLSAQGLERQMATNHLGHAALVTGLWPLLHDSATRVVLVSSIAARGGRLSATTTRDELVAPTPYRAQQVYANTKQANLLFALELSRRSSAAGSPVTAVAVHPGVSSTNLFRRQVQESGFGLLAPLASLLGAVTMQSAVSGAQPTLRGLHPSTPSGAYVGPARLGQSRGRPELLDLPSTARDPATAARLWELTAQVLDAPLPV